MKYGTQFGVPRAFAGTTGQIFFETRCFASCKTMFLLKPLFTDDRHYNRRVGTAPNGLFDLIATVQNDHRFDENVADPNFHATVTAGRQVHVRRIRRFLQRFDNAQMRHRLGRLAPQIVVFTRVDHTVTGADQIRFLVEPEKLGRVTNRFRIFLHVRNQMFVALDQTVVLAYYLPLERAVPVPIAFDAAARIARHLHASREK